MNYCKCGCGRELSDRYKGRAKQFYSAECRKKWHDNNPNKSVYDTDDNLSRK